MYLPQGFSPNEMMDRRGMPLFLTVHAAFQYRREPRTSNTGKAYSLRFSGCDGESNFVKSRGEDRRIEYL